MKKIAFFIISTLVLTVSVFAQANLEIYKADLSIPFGEANGKILAVSDHLVFVDDDKPEHSFAIARGNVAAISREGSILVIETKQAVADRSGMKSRFVMRVDNDGAEKLSAWLNTGAEYVAARKTSAPTVVNSPVSNRTGLIYEVQHNHRLYGNCSGRLIFGDDRISFESADDRDHSRQWLFTDIKKLKRKSPYKLDVQTFDGEGYSLEILGSGIDITDSKTIEDKIAAAKTARQ